MQQCPEFFSPVNNGCVYDCSQHSLFRLTTANAQPKCEYEFDASLFVELIPQNTIPVPLPDVGSGSPPPVPTLKSLESTDPARATRYKTELDRVDAAIQGLLSKMDRARRVAHAFQALQTAELTRATDPIGYQQARNQYYTLVKGPEWVEEEKARIRSAEVEPEIRQYRDIYTTAMQQKVGQQRTLDIIEAVKDRVLSLKDDFQYSTSMFKEQLDRVKSQLNIERRGRDATTGTEDAVAFSAWLNILLNLALAIVGVYGALTLWTVIKKRWPSEQRAYTLVAAKD